MADEISRPELNEDKTMGKVAQKGKAKYPFSWVRLLVTISLIAFTSVVVGVSIWYIMDQQIKTEKKTTSQKEQELTQKSSDLKKYIEDSNKQIKDLQDKVTVLEKATEDPATAGPDKIVDFFERAKQKANYNDAKNYVTSNVVNYFGGDDGFKAEVQFGGVIGYTIKEAGVYPSKTTYKITITERMASVNPETGETTYYTLDIPITLVQTANGWKIDVFEVPMGMGKPVVYLYPKNPTNVHVEVAPNGGLSYTEPKYNNGWDVLANPNGNLLFNGINYPYLFWEGSSPKIKVPNEGFMVKKENVSRFLDEKLSTLGLNSKEIRDFKEYWVPRMQQKPYYFINFISKAEIDRVAPLNISPKPDSTIRVLMYYKGTNIWYPVIEQKLNKVSRSGFSAVEWGGIFGK